jgi:hypothetical protein
VERLPWILLRKVLFVLLIYSFSVFLLVCCNFVYSILSIYFYIYIYRERERERERERDLPNLLGFRKVPQPLTYVSNHGLWQTTIILKSNLIVSCLHFTSNHLFLAQNIKFFSSEHTGPRNKPSLDLNLGPRKDRRERSIIPILLRRDMSP